MSDSSEANNSGPSYPTSFGRGWIPADRDIGLPDDDLLAEAVGETAAARVDSRAPDRDTALRGEAGPLHHPADGSPPRAGEEPRANHNGWTRPRKAAFLHHLAEKGNVRAAAARVGLTHQSAYVARRRDRVFDAGWQAALVLARGVAEEALGTRALDGIEEPVWFRGEQVGLRRRHDSRLLLAHLARLDKAAEETEAGDLAARFDELVAVVAGETVADGMVDPGESWDAPVPLLPHAREPFAERRAVELQDAAFAQWEADVEEGRAGEDDEPSALNTPWFEAALGEWDAWHARACASVDAAVATESKGPPTKVFPRVEIDMAAFYADDDDFADDDDPDDDPRPHWRDLGYGPEDVVIVDLMDDATAMEMAESADDQPDALPNPRHPRERGDPSPELAVGGEDASWVPAFAGMTNERGAGRNLPSQDTGNCGNLPQPEVPAAPSFLASRQPSALARFVAGQRPGREGETPQRRSSPLKARASASAKLHSERQVIDSDTDGSGPLRTKCGAMTGT